MNPDTPFSALALRELKAAAAVTAQPIQAVEARSADQVVTGVEAAAKAGAPGHAGRCVAGEYSSANRRSRHNDSAAIVYGSRAFPEAGGLISYGVDRRHKYRRAAEYMDMILEPLQDRRRLLAKLIRKPRSGLVLNAQFEQDGDFSSASFCGTQAARREFPRARRPEEPGPVQSR